MANWFGSCGCAATTRGYTEELYQHGEKQRPTKEKLSTLPIPYIESGQDATECRSRTLRVRIISSNHACIMQNSGDKDKKSNVSIRPVNHNLP